MDRKTNSYFFILGRNPALSFAEIISVLKKNSVSYAIRYVSREVLVVTTGTSLEVNNYIDKLGGTVKIGKIVSEVSKEKEGIEWGKTLTPEFLLESFVSGQNGKIHFGTSLYNLTCDDRYVAQYNREQGRVNGLIKKMLKKVGVSSGFVQSPDRFLATATILYNKLLSRGFEFVILVSEDKVLLGKTLEIQDFNSFSFRDMNRPFRDKKSGIIPPKLARIMINLSQKNTDAVLLDPFCGSGTIPLEAHILGFNHVLASDSSEKAVHDTYENLEWAKIHVLGFRGESAPKVIHADATSLSIPYGLNSVDLIVTEPYLGPTVFQKPTKESVVQLFKELSLLYRKAVKEFFKVLKPTGIVVMVFPAFLQGAGYQLIETGGMLDMEGFEKVNRIPDQYWNLFSLEITGRGTIIYGGELDRVLREIVVFRKK